jgi:hypothetical protein
MKITERKLRRIIRNVIAEQQDQKIDEGMKENIGVAIACALAWWAYGNGKTSQPPSDPSACVPIAAELCNSDPDCQDYRIELENAETGINDPGTEMTTILSNY